MLCPKDDCRERNLQRCHAQYACSRRLQLQVDGGGTRGFDRYPEISHRRWFREELRAARAAVRGATAAATIGGLRGVMSLFERSDRFGYGFGVCNISWLRSPLYHFTLSPSNRCRIRALWLVYISPFLGTCHSGLWSSVLGIFFLFLLLVFWPVT